MSDEVSVFAGVKPKPVGVTDWLKVLENIKSEKYKSAIERCREIEDPAQYRIAKTKLPAVTFSAKFNGTRNVNSVESTTGFIIPDLDHLEDVESVFSSLVQDENVWFAFRSPSGTGIKCGIRADGITDDSGIKVLFDAIHRYFVDTYGIQIDPACKDIARLTFVSCDPNLYLNESPCLFNVSAWTRRPEQRFYLPLETNNGWKSQYGQRVLESSCQKIIDSVRGEQHGTRLRVGRLVGGFIASGHIDEGVAMSQLENAVIQSGAVRVADAMKTVVDGIQFGKKNPIHPEPRPAERKRNDISFHCDVDECFSDESVSGVSGVSNVSGVSEVGDDMQCLANVSECKQGVSSVSRISDENSANKTENLMGYILGFIEDSSGSFTVDQVDREFCLTTRIEKNYRSLCLHRCIEKKLISRDKRIKGKYHILNSDIDVIDITNVVDTSFQLKLPFNLHDYTTLPQKCIVIIAGSSNAGKTALILNILKDNLSAQYKKMYLMSEMGAGEYVERLKRFDLPLDAWKSVTAAERSFDFNGVIEHHNRDGLTCIDFLEEVDGEYFKIATDIRNIYEALGDGVAIIAIQKKTDSDYARGGQATTEKARLYMSVDLISVLEHSIICALKIIKLKRYVGRNLQNHEIHFRIHSGSKIEAVSDWMKSEPGLRERMKLVYEQPNPDKYQMRKGSYEYEFLLTDGQIVGVNGKDLNQWRESFSSLDVDGILQKISERTFAKKTNLGKNWFHALAGILRREQEKETF